MTLGVLWRASHECSFLLCPTMSLAGIIVKLARLAARSTIMFWKKLKKFVSHIAPWTLDWTATMIADSEIFITISVSKILTWLPSNRSRQLSVDLLIDLSHLVAYVQGENAWVFSNEDNVANCAKAFIEFEKGLKAELPREKRKTAKPTDISGNYIFIVIRNILYVIEFWVLIHENLARTALASRNGTKIRHKTNYELKKTPSFKAAFGNVAFLRQRAHWAKNTRTSQLNLSHKEIQC